jgi:uncharacterized repeat protein (TIGR01451 family)
VLTLGALVSTVAAGCDVPQPWRLDQVTVDPSGTVGGDGDTTAEPFFRLPVAVSADGSTVAFATLASNLATGVQDNPGQFGPIRDVYVRDLETGVTELVSVAPDGVTSGDNTSDPPAISPDGTKVVFSSAATNLGAPGNGLRRIYLRDLVAGTTSLVSANGAGTESVQNGAALQPVFSPDGTKVAFHSTASDFGPADANGPFGMDVYLRDLVTGATELVSVNAAGTEAAPGANIITGTPVFSPDGTKLAFLSVAGDLVAGVPPQPITNGLARLYVRDLVAGVTTLVSATPAGGAAGGEAGDPRFGPDGTELAFTSTGGDLVPGVAGGAANVYVRDLVAATTAVVSANAAGTAGGNGTSHSPRFAGDDHVVFASTAANLGPVDPNGGTDVYMRDLTSGTTSLVSVNAAGTAAGDRASAAPAVSPDGRRVAFVSAATDLGPPPGPRADVYVRDLATGTTSQVTGAVPGTTGAPVSVAFPQFTPTGRLIFESDDTDLGPASSAGHLQLYVATFVGADVAATLDAAVYGDKATLTATATNAGPDPATGTELAVLVPEGVTLDSFTGDGSCAVEPGPRTVVACNLGVLAVGDVATLTIEATVTAPPGTAVEALALARSDTLDPVQASNFVSAMISRSM